MNNIDKSVLHEILRKLTPAIGRVLGKREKTRPCDRDKNHHDAYCSTCDWIEEVNDALEQVLNADIVEAMVKNRCHIEDGRYYRTDITIDDIEYIVYCGRDCVEIKDIQYAWLDLPALVAEAWEV